jgi:hypothetical protein
VKYLRSPWTSCWTCCSSYNHRGQRLCNSAVTYIWFPSHHLRTLWSSHAGWPSHVTLGLQLTYHIQHISSISYDCKSKLPWCNNSQRSIESICFGKHSQYFNRAEPPLCRAVKAIFHELARSLPIHQFCRSMHTLSFEVLVESLPCSSSRTLFCPRFDPVTKELIGFDLLEKRRLNKWLLLLLRISHQD